METKYKILFVDDERFFARPFVDELERFSAVVVRTSALEAVDEFNNRANDYICAVLDVMLPPPVGWEVKTKEGIDTGIEVLRCCRDNIISAMLPVVVLTNRASEYVKGEVTLMVFPEWSVKGGGLIECRSKLETPPFDLANVVKRLVKNWKGINLS